MFNITKFDFPPHISLLSIFGSNNFLPSIFGVSSKNLLPLKCYDIKKKKKTKLSKLTVFFSISPLSCYLVLSSWLTPDKPIIVVVHGHRS